MMYRQHILKDQSSFHSFIVKSSCGVKYSVSKCNRINMLGHVYGGHSRISDNDLSCTTFLETGYII